MESQLNTAIRVLLADDDLEFSGVAKLYIEADGHACDHVPDARSAIQALEKKTYDLLISDIGMPGNRHLELVKALAKMPERPPIILLTGNPTIETATKSVGLVVFAYITKTCAPEELRQLIRDAGAHGRVRRAILEGESRIKTWSDDIARIRELLHRAPDAPAGLQSYVTMTLSNLVSALGDFAEVTEVIARSDPHKQHVESAALVKALQETVEVLENTRHLFKSKELGNLRKKLEQLLR